LQPTEACRARQKFQEEAMATTLTPTPGGTEPVIPEASLYRLSVAQCEAMARAGFPVYWIISVKTRRQRIEVYTDPAGGARPTYRQRRDYQPGESVPLVLDSTVVDEVAVSDLLP
jgi:hypothetical protein